MCSQRTRVPTGSATRPVRAEPDPGLLCDFRTPKRLWVLRALFGDTEHLADGALV